MPVDTRRMPAATSIIKIAHFNIDRCNLEEYFVPIITDPDFAPLHKDPRWDQMLKDVGLYEYRNKLKRL